MAASESERATQESRFVPSANPPCATNPQPVGPNGFFKRLPCGAALGHRHVLEAGIFLPVLRVGAEFVDVVGRLVAVEHDGLAGFPGQRRLAGILTTLLLDG